MVAFQRSWGLAAALAIALVIVVSGDALAQSGQPTSVNPTASSVMEGQLLDALKPPGSGPSAVTGRVSIPDTKSSVLIQPAGRDWRQIRQETLPFYGAIAILGMLAALVIFYLIRGRIAIDGGPSGRTILRFASADRFAHWLTASTFILLALSGLNLTFGRKLLLPLIGPEAFTALSQAGKFVHNYGSFAFALGVVLKILLWLKDNIPSGADLAWFSKGGGLIGSDHPPAGRFNGGQKVIFWVVVIGGVALSITGYSLMFPFVFTDIAGLQEANMLHGLIAVGMVAVILAHIYIGSVGMEGAFDAMGKGEVDLNWAKQHHALWVEKTEMKGKGAATPAE